MDTNLKQYKREVIKRPSEQVAAPPGSAHSRIMVQSSHLLSFAGQKCGTIKRIGLYTASPANNSSVVKRDIHVTAKACPDGVKKDGHFHLAPPNLKFVLWPRTDIELPSNYAEFDSPLDCIQQLF